MALGQRLSISIAWLSAATCACTGTGEVRFLQEQLWRGTGHLGGQRLQNTLRGCLVTFLNNSENLFRMLVAGDYQVWLVNDLERHGSFEYMNQGDLLPCNGPSGLPGSEQHDLAEV